MTREERLQQEHQAALRGLITAVDASGILAGDPEFEAAAEALHRADEAHRARVLGEVAADLSISLETKMIF